MPVNNDLLDSSCEKASNHLPSFPPMSCWCSFQGEPDVDLVKMEVDTVGYFTASRSSMTWLKWGSSWPWQDRALLKPCRFWWKGSSSLKYSTMVFLRDVDEDRSEGSWAIVFAPARRFPCPLADLQVMGTKPALGDFAGMGVASWNLWWVWWWDDDNGEMMMKMRWGRQWCFEMSIRY